MWAVAAAAALTGIVSFNFATRVAKPRSRRACRNRNRHHLAVASPRRGPHRVSAAVAIGLNLSRSHRAGEDGELRSGKKASIKGHPPSRGQLGVNVWRRSRGQPAVLGTDASER